MGRNHMDYFCWYDCQRLALRVVVVLSDECRSAVRRYLSLKLCSFFSHLPISWSDRNKIPTYWQNVVIFCCVFGKYLIKKCMLVIFFVWCLFILYLEIKTFITVTWKVIYTRWKVTIKTRQHMKDNHRHCHRYHCRLVWMISMAFSANWSAAICVVASA